VKVLVFPRNSNPYQDDLYGAMGSSRDLEVRYLEGPTRSQTVNLVLLPLALIAARGRGFRILHVHWVYPFGLTWAASPLGRRLVEWWYLIFLRMAAGLGFKIVWTAHNIVPHEQVFPDDLVARRHLAARCDAVIAHSREAASIIGSWSLGEVDIIPPGIASRPADDHTTTSVARNDPNADRRTVQVLFFGMIRDYKGVDILLEAVASSRFDPHVDVVIVGSCPDGVARERLFALADSTPHPDRLHMELGFVAESELDMRLAAADFAVFPFRAVTSSSSVGHALAWGLPVIIPSIAALDDVPRDAAIRYEPAESPDALADALACAASTSEADRSDMEAAARRFAMRRTWPAAAAATWQVFDGLFSTVSESGAGSVDVRQPRAVR
jgi:glycosyltransferase involved in cell wall biosynthesis